MFKEKNKNLLRLKLKSALKIEQISGHPLKIFQFAQTRPMTFGYG